MAILHNTNGTTQEVTPANSKDFTLEELYKLTNSETVQYVPLPDGSALWMDEEGKINGRQVPNPQATHKFGRHLLPGDVLMGPVLQTTEGEVE